MQGRDGAGMKINLSTSSERTWAAPKILRMHISVDLGFGRRTVGDAVTTLTPFL